MLSSLEPFDRGFYSGPFGWVSGAASEFAVAIRSALIHPPKVRIICQLETLSLVTWEVCSDPLATSLAGVSTMCVVF